MKLPFVIPRFILLDIPYPPKNIHLMAKQIIFFESIFSLKINNYRN